MGDARITAVLNHLEATRKLLESLRQTWVADQPMSEAIEHAMLKIREADMATRVVYLFQVEEIR